MDESSNSSISKRTSAGAFICHDEKIAKRLNEESEHEFSDVDDEGDDPYFQPEIENLVRRWRNFRNWSHLRNLFKNQLKKNVQLLRKSHLNVSKVKMDLFGIVTSAQEHQELQPTICIIRLPRRLNYNSNFKDYFELWSKLIEPSSNKAPRQNLWIQMLLK